jgi:phosphoglycolate phosphatase
MNNQPEKKVALFDIDGTLIRCNGAGKESLLTACKDVFGTTGRMEEVNFQGKTDPLILEESLHAMSITTKEINYKIDKLKDTYFSYLLKNMKEGKGIILPGIRELLDKLSESENILTGLLTGNFKTSAGIKLNHFGLNKYFQFGVFGDDAANRNEMPAIAQKRVEEQFGHSIPFEEMFIIGDTIYDIICAQTVNAVSISVGTGWSPRENLLAQKPDYFFDDLTETDRIINVIKKG